MEHDRRHWFAGGYSMTKLGKAHEEVRETRRAAEDAVQSMQLEILRIAEEYKEAERERDEAVKALEALKNARKDR